MMTNTSPPLLESLISLAGNDENFLAITSHLQSLYLYLQENPSTQCEDDYVKLMAHLLENYLNAPKKLGLRQHLVEMIARQTNDDYAAQYFRQRFTHAELLDLLQHHRSLTGTRLVLTNVDYDHQKFKLKICPQSN